MGTFPDMINVLKMTYDIPALPLKANVETLKVFRKLQKAFTLFMMAMGAPGGLSIFCIW